MSQSNRYTTKAAILHWVIGIMIIAVYLIGDNWASLAEEYPDIEAAPPEVVETGNTLYFLHESIGITVLLLVFWRIVWRVKNKPPALPASMAKWNKLAASAVHYFLYALMLVMPLTGFLSGMIGGFGAMFWGLYIPPIAENEALGSAIFNVHGIGATLILNIVLLHILAAIYHFVRSRFSSHPNVLKRMWPFGQTQAG